MRGIKKEWILVACFIASTAAATVVVRAPFNEQAKKADLVLVGKVTRVEDIEISGFPFSRAIISIEEVIAGTTSNAEIYVLQPGGKKRTGGQAIVGGMRYLKAGDEVFLMLRARGDGGYEIIGFNQGHYPLMKDKHTGRRVIEVNENGRKKYLTVDGAKRRIHAVRAGSSSEEGGR